MASLADDTVTFDDLEQVTLDNLFASDEDDSEYIYLKYLLQRFNGCAVRIEDFTEEERQKIFERKDKIDLLSGQAFLQCPTNQPDRGMMASFFDTPENE